MDKLQVIDEARQRVIAEYEHEFKRRVEEQLCLIADLSRKLACAKQTLLDMTYTPPDFGI
jgi:hypothetical protein